MNPGSLQSRFRGTDLFFMRAFRFRWLTLGLLHVAMEGGELKAAVYRREIKPILEEHCYSCHSRLKQKADLRLDAGLLIHKGGKNGPVVVAGKKNESLLIEKIRSTDDDERMPPEGKPLSLVEVALLEEWIVDGADFPPDERIPATPAEHRSFQPSR